MRVYFTLGSTGRGRDNVGTSATASTPVLAGGTVDGLLGGGGSVNGGHQTLNDTKLVVNDLGKRGQAVGGAGSVRDDLVFGLVGIQVDTADEHGSIGRRSRDDDLLGTADQVSLSLLNGGEDTSGFDNVGSFVLGPRDLGGVTLGVHGNGLTIDNKLAVLGLNSALVATVGRVVLEHVDHVVQSNEGVVDGNNLDVRVLQGSAKDNTANTTETNMT